MINLGWNSASILGVFLAVAGAGLYFLRSVRPELSRDYDIFFAAVGLACGGILLFNGWRLDPILQFGQFLLALSTFFFAFETLRLRGLATEQAKRSTPIVDDDRPVSRSYKAYREPDYDELEPAYREPDYVPRKRLRGSDDDYDATPAPRRNRRSAAPTVERERPPEGRTSEGRSRPPRNRDRDRRYPERGSERERSERRSNREPSRYSDDYDEWGEAWTEDFESETRSARGASRSERYERDRPPAETASRRPRSRDPLYEDEETAPYVDYVDYDPAQDIDFEEPDEPTVSRDRAPRPTQTPSEPSPRERAPEADVEDDFDDEFASDRYGENTYTDELDERPRRSDPYRAPRGRDEYDDDDYGY